IKDVFHVAGRVTTGGLRRPLWGASQKSATVIKRLLDAGAILLGTLNTHELQLGGTMEFPYGLPRNPHDLARITGGSSSGSASAVSAGLCSFSLGGDTGGSVRVPASYCGVLGLKPTWSLLSRYGMLQAHWTLDSVGLITRSADDLRVVLESITGHDPLDPTTSRRVAPSARDLNWEPHSFDGMRIGLVEQFFDAKTVHPEVLNTSNEAVSK